MVWWNKTNKNLVGWGGSQNLNQQLHLLAVNLHADGRAVS